MTYNLWSARVQVRYSSIKVLIANTLCKESYKNRFSKRRVDPFALSKSTRTFVVASQLYNVKTLENEMMISARALCGWVGLHGPLGFAPRNTWAAALMLLQTAILLLLVRRRWR